MSDDVQTTGMKTPKPFTDSRADVAEMKDIGKRLRKNLALDTDGVYGRLLATPQWYYSTHNGGGFREVLAALSGESTTGGRPLYVTPSSITLRTGGLSLPSSALGSAELCSWRGCPRLSTTSKAVVDTNAGPRDPPGSA